MKVNKLQNYLILVYIIFLVSGFFYVKNVLEHTSIREVDKDKNEVEEVKPAKAYLIFQDKQKFEARLQNTDTVGDFLNNLRDKKFLFFERTMYTYGTELSDINNVKTPQGYEWKVYFNGKDITFDIDNIKLIDESTYELKLVKQ